MEFIVTFWSSIRCEDSLEEVLEWRNTILRHGKKISSSWVHEKLILSRFTFLLSYINNYCQYQSVISFKLFQSFGPFSSFSSLISSVLWSLQSLDPPSPPCDGILRPILSLCVGGLCLLMLFSSCSCFLFLSLSSRLHSFSCTLRLSLSLVTSLLHFITFSSVYSSSLLTLFSLSSTAFARHLLSINSWTSIHLLPPLLDLLSPTRLPPGIAFGCCPSSVAPPSPLILPVSCSLQSSRSLVFFQSTSFSYCVYVHADIDYCFVMLAPLFIVTRT